MDRSIRPGRRLRTVAVSCLIPTVCIAFPASAEIYKCVAKSGVALYQNFPCQYDSNPDGKKTGSPATNAIASKPPTLVIPTFTPGAVPGAVPVAPVVVAANAPQVVKPADPNEPAVGTPSEQVRAALGEPLEIVQDQPTEGIETWRYVNKNVQIDHASQLVVELQSW